MRGLHLNDDHSVPEDHLGTGSDPQPTSSPPSTTRQLPQIPSKRKRDHTKVIHARIENGHLEPSEECSGRITHLFTQRNDLEGVNWKKVTRDTKDFYWREYLRHTTHIGFDEEAIFSAWKKKAAKRYRDWMSMLSKLPVKPKKKGIPDSNWAAWSTYWKTDEFKIKSARGTSNQNRHGKGKNIHTAGSQTFTNKLKKLWDKNEYPDPAEFHELTHTRKNQPGIFCDDHASKVQDEYLSKKQEMLLEMQTQAEAGGLPKPDSLSLEHRTALFKEVVGGERKGGGLYGSGSAVDHFYYRERRAPSSSIPQLSNAQEVVELRQKVLDLTKEVARGKEERDHAIAKAVDDAIRQTLHSVEGRVFKKVKKMMKKDHQRRYYSESEASTSDDDNDDVC